jgi:uncharacterized coiled-coil protein SlyX
MSDSPTVTAIAHLGRKARELTTTLQAEVVLLDEINQQLCVQNESLDKRCAELERMCDALDSALKTLLAASLDPMVRERARATLAKWEGVR